MGQYGLGEVPLSCSGLDDLQVQRCVTAGNNSDRCRVSICIWRTRNKSIILRQNRKGRTPTTSSTSSRRKANTLRGPLLREVGSERAQVHTVDHREPGYFDSLTTEQASLPTYWPSPAKSTAEFHSNCRSIPPRCAKLARSVPLSSARCTAKFR